MKDYTKYDFRAIVGAEVSIVLKNRHKWGGTLKLIDEESKSIFLCPNGDLRKANWFAIEDIVPGSLTAEIKVEDMNVRQLERHFKFDCDTHLVLNTCEANTCRFVNGGFADVSAPTALSAKIDCTKWGWK